MWKSSLRISLTQKENVCVDDVALKAEPFLGGYRENFGTVELVEIVDLSIVSLAIPLDGLAIFTKAIKAILGLAIPKPGTTQSADAGIHLLRTSPDQLLLLLHDTIAPSDVVSGIGTSGYCTDQSDNWVTLRLKGPMARTALERICPIDIDPEVFPKGAFARTSMEHLGAFIISEGDYSYLLLSASSSAGSFLHAIKTSIQNVV
jgi:heterotetrameric sarcosine oxidase gamma subunit